MAGIEQVGEAIGTGEDHNQESPRLRRGRHPGVGHGAIERTVSPEVVGRDPEKRAPRRHEVRPPTQPADDWCADRQTLWHELEDRRTAGDIAVDPARLSTAIAPRGAPLGAKPAPARGGASVEPADAWNVGGPRVPAEEKRDVRHAGGGGEHRRPHRHSTRLDHPPGKIGKVPLREESAQHVVSRAVYQNEDDPAVLRMRRKNHRVYYPDLRWRGTRSVGCLKPLSSREVLPIAASLSGRDHLLQQDRPLDRRCEHIAPCVRHQPAVPLDRPIVEGALDLLEWNRWLVADARGYVFAAPIERRRRAQHMLGRRREGTEA